MGLLGRIRNRRSTGSEGEPGGELLAGLPERIVAGFSPDAELARGFPSIPPDHLAVLVAFINVGSAETGAGLQGADLQRALEHVCRDYEGGRLQVRRVGTDWQVWGRQA